jgi:hypothetical protein
MTSLPILPKILAPTRPVTFELGDDLPDGLRLSESCEVKRVRQFFNEDHYAPFDEGVGVRGHVIEQLFTKGVLPDLGLGDVDLQMRMQWKHGISHADAITKLDGHWTGWEIKSVKERSPDESHIEQVHRMATLAPGIARWLIVLINPTNYRISGPFLVNTTEQIRERVNGMLDDTDLVMRRIGNGANPDEADTYDGLECTCGQCFPTPTTIASAGIDDLATSFQWAKETKADAEVEGDEIKAQIAARMKPGEKVELTYLHGSVTYRPERTGKRIAWGDAYKAGVIPEEAVERVRAAGYELHTKTEAGIVIRAKRREQNQQQ